MKFKAITLAFLLFSGNCSANPELFDKAQEKYNLDRDTVITLFVYSFTNVMMNQCYINTDLVDKYDLTTSDFQYVKMMREFSVDKIKLMQDYKMVFMDRIKKGDLVLTDKVCSNFHREHLKAKVVK